MLDDGSVDSSDSRGPGVFTLEIKFLDQLSGNKTYSTSVIDGALFASNQF